MKEILVIFFLFAAYLNAANTEFCSNFSIENELSTIKSICLTTREKELMNGDVSKDIIATMFLHRLIPMAQETIGLSEMRKALGFKKLGPWTKYSRKKPSEEQLKNAKKIEEYYELKEPKNKDRSLDSGFLFEKNVWAAVKFFDERIPEIRKIYKCEFAEVLRGEKGSLNRVTINKMIEKWNDIWFDIEYALNHIKCD
ncbi:unnamed protein product [Caenorhabditis angaria]|uniref:Uncharacterized protein n=1 Tax=Caenorhabditis angaria TaxID=860376 RepID=A0A9P1IUA3_9PELO|nr:unnamed protein product [Caenorhabditis angaria]